MTEETLKSLAGDNDGLLTYEYIANHIESCHEDIDSLIENMERADLTGQFLVSTARYLNAIDSDRFAPAIKRLIATAIERDREHRYIGDLLPEIWGDNYADHVVELSNADDNFRRIYKRLFPKGF